MKKYLGMLTWMQNNLDSVRLYPHLNEIIANCPFCHYRHGSPDVKNHFYVSTINRVANCYRCEWKGNWISLIMEVEGCSYTEAILQIASQPTLDEYEKTINEFKQGKSSYKHTKESSAFPNGFITLDNCDESVFLHKLAVKYLRSRNINEDFIYSGIFGIVPGVMRIYMLASDTYWQARTFYNAPNKYINPNREKMDVLGLWDVDGLRDYIDSLGDDIFICEGLISAISIVQRGFPALALLGKYARHEQLVRLADINKNLIVMLDCDAEKQAYTLASALRDLDRTDVRIAKLKEDDPATCFDYTLHTVGLKDYALWKMS